MPNDMTQFARRALRWLPPPERLAEARDDFRGAVLLRVDAGELDPGGAQFPQFRSEVAMTRGLHRDSVDREERPAVARGQRQAVGVVDAAEAAIVLGEVDCPRGEAPRVVRQRQPSPHRDLELRRGVTKLGFSVEKKLRYSGLPGIDIDLLACSLATPLSAAGAP